MQVESVYKNKILNLLKEYIFFIRNKSKVLAGFLILGLLIGLAYAIFKKPTFEAKLVFMLNDNKSNNLGGLSALAGQLGLGQTTGLNVSEDRVFYLAYTKRVIGGALLNKSSNNLTLGDKLIEIRNLKAAWGKDSILCQFDKFVSKEISQLSRVENKAIDQLIQIILLSKRYSVESYKKKVSSLVGSQSSGMMYISFEFIDELFAKEFVEAVYNEMSNFYSLVAVKSLQNNYDLISSREDSVRKVLRDLEDQMAITIDDNFQVKKYIGKVNENRLRRNIEILNLFYAEVIKNKELARFNLEQDKPVFQIVDSPMLPLEAKFKSKIVYSLLAGFALLFMFIGFYSISFFYLKWKNGEI